MFNIQRVLLLALKKVEMVEFTSSLIPTTQYNRKNPGKFHVSSNGGSPPSGRDRKFCLQVMLVMVLIDVQYLYSVAFSFKKG